MRGEPEYTNDRQGFIRLDASKCIVKHEKAAPTWQFVKSIQSADKLVGRLLFNARLVAKEDKGKVHR